MENLKEKFRSKETDSLAREDSTEATIATMLAQAAENVSQRDPLKKNVPSSSELDVRNTMSVRYVKYVLLAYQIDLIAFFNSSMIVFTSSARQFAFYFICLFARLLVCLFETSVEPF